MIARALSGVLALSAVLAAAWSPGGHRQGPAAPRVAADTFPHARHAGLFTTCDACHAGIATGDTASFFPSPDLCAGCHNGDMARRVDWQPRPVRATNVALEHVPHVAMFAGMEGGAETACQRCHAHADSVPFMDVGRADPERCVTCHGQGATSHLTQQSCEPCHTTLHDAAALDVVAIRGFPRPPSHDSTWILHHQEAAAGPTCAVCHAQQFCASCHVNARSVEAVRKLAADDRVAAIVAGERRTYPLPPSHTDPAWAQRHGAVARAGVTECANCHARESCIGCHRVQERVPALAGLPRRAGGGAFGVDLVGLKPADHQPDMALRHRVLAAGGTATCSTCHRPSYCASCHDAARAPGFHGATFVQRHAQQAYAAEAECAACHQTQIFCRDCHRTLGRANTNAPVGAGRYHDKQPGWLFGHGGVARRAIETCASCHAQDFCLRCHSATTGWHINPHGPSFDPGVEGKNRAMCLICHTTGVPKS